LQDKFLHLGIIQRQGIRNSIITYVGIAIGAVSLLIIQPRFLTKEEIGLTRLLFSFSTILGNLMSLGVTATIMRYFPYFRDRDRNHHGFFGFMLIFPFLGYIFFASLLFLFKGYVIAKYVNQSRLFTDYFYYIFPFSFFLTFTSILTAYSQSIFRTSVPALINDVLVRIVFIILITVYFIHWIDRDQFIMLFVAIYGTQFVVLIFYLFIEDRPSLKIDWDKYTEHTPKAMFIYGIILSLGGLAALGLKYLDVIVLGTYKPKEAALNALDIVGIYSIAAFVATFIEAPITALDKIIVPKMADGWKRNDIADIRQIYYKSAKYLFLIGGLLFLLINLNIDSLFLLIPDRDYSLAKGVVFIISLGTLINMATGNNDAILYTSTRYRIMIWLLMGLVIVAYINYKIFIPLFGMEGAAFATALSAFLYNLVKYLLIWRYFDMQPFTIDTVKVIGVIVITGIVGYYIPSIHNPFADVAIHSSVIGIVFGGLVYILKIVPEFHYLIPFLKDKE
jgi:O-antigen/teichoic acid export membrane protein